MSTKNNYHKLGNEDKLKLLNEMLIEVERRKMTMATDQFIKMDLNEQAEFIKEIKRDMAEVERLNEEINRLISYAPDVSKKLFLTDIIDIERPVFGTNNLIISPVGSGKTTFITERLVEPNENYLLLVSTEGLKESLAPNSDEIREEYGNRMFTSENKNVFGKGKYKIHVMTYAEFGEKIYVNDKFIKNKDFKKIFCDEIHSLPAYIKYGGERNAGLIHAQRFLFNHQPGIQIFYFTATETNLLQAERERKGTLSVAKMFDYSNYPNIMRYMPKAIREINHIEQIRQYLKDRKIGFDYYNYKGVAFSKTISSLKRIEEIVKEEGYNPLVLWSENNGDHKMNDDQKAAREELLKTNKIPEPYDFLIFNSALQEGWDLKDNSVKLAIMNTTNETEYIQALGRLRRDVDLLIYRTKVKRVKIDEVEVVVPDNYLNVPLSTEKKEELASALKVINSEGNPAMWITVKKMIADTGNYILKDSTRSIDGKRKRVTTIIPK